MTGQAGDHPHPTRRAGTADAPADEASGAVVGPDDDDGDEDEGLSLNLTTRGVLTLVAFVGLTLLALYLILPQLTGLDDTWRRVERGAPGWTIAAFLFTFGMFGGYIAMFRGIFIGAGRVRLGWRESYQITMAGLAASRLFAAGGAGGLVLQAWALRRAGLGKRVVADKTLSFLILTYAPYTAAIVVCGFGLRLGVLAGAAPFSLTVIPALVGLVAFAIAGALYAVPTDLQRRVDGWARRTGRFGRLVQRFAHVPAAASAGLHDAWVHVRTRDPGIIGAFLFWGAQVAVLWAAFHAFGSPPPLGVLVLAFFVGMLGNLLPIPGGVGGVEGGLIGAYAAFGVDAGLAVVAVLVFRAFTFWLPLLPGVVAFFQLRRTVERWRAARLAGRAV